MSEQLDQSESGKAAGPSRPIRERARRTAAAVRPSLVEDKEQEERFFVRHRAKLIGAVLIVLVGGAFYFVKPGKNVPAQRAPERIMTIQLPPLPPPPPPPPKLRPPPPPEQKMVEQAPVETPDKPKEEAPKPKDEPPPAALGTGIKGDGTGLSGLGASGNGGGFGGGKSGAGGSKWGWYAGQVQSRIAEALRRNQHTLSASIQIQVRIWADPAGRVTKARLDASTGDAQIDKAIQDEVLTGLQLSEPPPAGMPMPIVLRLHARRP